MSRLNLIKLFIVLGLLSISAQAATHQNDRKDTKLTERLVYNARIGHAAVGHRKRSGGKAPGLERRRRRSVAAVKSDNAGVVHIPIEAVPRSAHSFHKHRHHAVHRHKRAIVIKRASNSSSSSTVGASKKEVQAALDNSITSPSGTAAKNSLGLSIEGADVGYFANITVGTPGKTFKILMDSGSADFWVPSETCSNAACGKHQRLGKTSSSTFSAANTSAFKVTYGTGEVEGQIISDDVNIAGLKLSDHSFGVTTLESQQFSDSSVPFDGLMGLAKSTLSEQQVLTPIEAMAKAGVVKSAIMGYSLGRVADNSNIGQVTFGGIDSTKFTGSLTTVKNTSPNGFWETSVDSITVNGKSVLSGKSAIMDTGTTLIVAPPADAIAVHKAIPGAKSTTGSDGSTSFVIPCTTNVTVAFKIGGKQFAIASEDLAFLPLDQNDLKGDCSSSITSGEIDGADTWLLGASFLKNNYLSTNVDDNTVGLAPAK